MSKAKKHTSMDHTSAAMATYLDKRREQNKKRAAKSNSKSGPARRGGYRR